MIFLSNNLSKLTAVNLDKLSDKKINTDKIKTVTLKEIRIFLCVEISKWKRNNNDDNQDADELSIKILRIILIFVTFSADKKNSVTKSDISMSVIYVEAVRDLIWKEMWKNIIYMKLTVLTANETWKETVSSRRVNIVISK